MEATSAPGAARRSRQRPVLRDRDAATVRLAAWARVLVTIAAAALGSVPEELSGRAQALFLVVGLAGVPWAIAVLLAAGRPGSRFAVVAGPIGDVVLLVVAHALVPSRAPEVLLGFLVAIAFAVYTAGRRVAVLLGATALVSAFGTQALLPEGDRLDAGLAVPFSAALLAVTFLLERNVLLNERANARYQRLQTESDTILTHIATGVVVTGGGGEIRRCNPAADRLIGGTGDHDHRGEHCHEVLGLHVGERRLDCSNGCPLLELGGELGAEVWREDGAGQRQPVLATVVPVPGSDDEVVHSLRDITRLKQAEEAKTLFLATASHELKTPLTVIRGFTETLLRHRETGADITDDALGAIHRRAIELSSIVDRLLLSSRIEAGNIRLDLKAVGIGPLLEERATAFGAATHRPVACVVEPMLPDVLGDAEAVVTVVDHLLDNAGKYSPPGTAITVRTGAGEGLVWFEVTDEGIGMDPEQAAQCFEKFWQAEATDVRRYGGTGIGLYIVRSLVEGIHGRISVRSAPGEGATFRVEMLEYVAPALEDPGLLAQPGDDVAPLSEPTSIREFMRQIGVPTASGRGAS